MVGVRGVDGPGGGVQRGLGGRQQRRGEVGRRLLGGGRAEHLQYSTLQYSIVQYNTVQYSAG